MALLVTLAGAPPLAHSADSVLHFKVNPTETTITASVAEPFGLIAGDATGAFAVVRGEVQGDPNSIADTGQVTLVIDAASYQSGNASRDQHVKENALEVEKFPTVTFHGDGFATVDKQGERSATVRLVGKLTVHGVTKDIVLPVAVRIDEHGRLMADGAYTLAFEEYDVQRPTNILGLITTGDTARIVFHVVADPA
jgi:polyisoprenoid-binding protein YceI